MSIGFSDKIGTDVHSAFIGAADDHGGGGVWATPGGVTDIPSREY
jgi:hypothetical protein